MIFTAPATLTAIRVLKDNGLGLSFVTKELTPEDQLIALRFHNQYGHVLFKEASIQESEIPDGDPTEEGAKTPGQRLRAVLFVLYKQRCGHTSVDFDSFYKSQLERMIDNVKRQLDD